MNIDTIYESFINGEAKQMTAQIDKYGPDFWRDFKEYLLNIWTNGQFGIYTDIVIKYHANKEG